jgi:hypothetical protein
MTLRSIELSIQRGREETVSARNSNLLCKRRRSTFQAQENCRFRLHGILEVRRLTDQLSRFECRKSAGLKTVFSKFLAVIRRYKLGPCSDSPRPSNTEPGLQIPICISGPQPAWQYYSPPRLGNQSFGLSFEKHRC